MRSCHLLTGVLSVSLSGWLGLALPLLQTSTNFPPGLLQTSTTFPPATSCWCTKWCRRKADWSGRVSVTTTQRASRPALPRLPHSPANITEHSLSKTFHF